MTDQDLQVSDPGAVTMIMISAPEGRRPVWTVAPWEDETPEDREPYMAAYWNDSPVVLMGDLDYLTTWAAGLTRALRRYAVAADNDDNDDNDKETTSGEQEDNDDRGTESFPGSLTARF